MTENEVKKHMETAAGFNQEGQAYVHAEYRNDKNPLIVAGDSIAVMRVIERIATRLAELSGQEFSDVIEAVEEMHRLDSMARRN